MSIVLPASRDLVAHEEADRPAVHPEASRVALKA
jgi:hypothetical protein